MFKIIKRKLFIILLIIVLVLFTFKLYDIVIKKIYPNKYEECVLECSEKYNVDKNLIYAIIKAESNFKEDAVSSRGAIGLMQIMPSTAKEVAKNIDINYEEQNLKDIYININIGVKYISILIEKYGNKEVALAAYNAGSGNIDNWIEKGIIKKDGTDIENIPYKETNNYVRKILRDYKIYQRLYKTGG